MKLLESLTSLLNIRLNAIVLHSRRKSGWLVQCCWLLWRTRLQSKRTVLDDWLSWFSYSVSKEAAERRDPKCATLETVILQLSIVFVGAFYAGTSSFTQEGIRSARGALYLTISEIIFTVAYSVVYQLPGELVLYLRESAVYAPGPYYSAVVLGSVTMTNSRVTSSQPRWKLLSRFLLEYPQIPKTTLKALLFTIVMYFALHSEFSLLDFGLYYLCTTVAAISGSAYGMMISSWVADVDVATTVMLLLDLSFLVTAGMFYNLRYVSVGNPSVPLCDE